MVEIQLLWDGDNSSIKIKQYNYTCVQQYAEEIVNIWQQTSMKLLYKALNKLVASVEKKNLCFQTTRDNHKNFCNMAWLALSF